MFEIYLFLAFILVAAIIATEIKDLLAAVISLGAVGFAVAIVFILVQAPDLAIVQIVVEVLTVVIFVAVILRTTHIDKTIGKKLAAISTEPAFVDFGVSMQPTALGTSKHVRHNGHESFSLTSVH